MSTTRNSHRRTTQVNKTNAAAHDVVQLNLGPLTDAASIQQAISAVICPVATGDLDCDRARLILCGLRIAATNVKQLGEAAKNTTAGEISKPVTEVAACEVTLAHQELEEEPASADDETAQEPCDTTETTTPSSKDDTSQNESADETKLAEPNEVADEEETAAATDRPRQRSGEVYIPPSCFAPAHKIYQGNARERILHFRQQRT